MYPPVEASGGQEQYYIRSDWHFEEMQLKKLRSQLSVRFTPSRGICWPRAVLHQVILTFGYPFGQADIQSDVLFSIYEFFNWSGHLCRVIFLLLLLLLCIFVPATATKLHIKKQQEEQKIILHTFSVQLSITQSFCCCCYCVVFCCNNNKVTQ